HDGDAEAESLRFLAPRVQVARVVVGKEQHVVVVPELEPARYEVVRLARVAGDDDLLRRDAERRGEQAPRFLASLRELRADGIRRIRVVLTRIPLDGLDDGERRRTEIRGVDEPEVGRQEETAPNLLPELFVRLERRGRQRSVDETPIVERQLGERALGQERGGRGQRKQSGEVAT